MENRPEEVLRLLQLSFIGKIIAGFTHEVKNHIAIIKESAGLMEDILKFGKKEKIDQGQFLEIIGSVGEQIERSLELFSHLNRFAHRMDDSRVSFDVNEALEDLISLLSRFARQRKISFEREFQKDIPAIRNDPALLQFLVFCYIEEAMTKLDKNSRIILSTSLSDGRISVGIGPRGDEVVSDKGMCSDEIRDYVIKRLGGTISQEKEETVINFVSMS